MTYQNRVDNNRTPYLQGRADQKRVDRVVAVVCLVLLAVYITWGK